MLTGKLLLKRRTFIQFLPEEKVSCIAGLRLFVIISVLDRIESALYRSNEVSFFDFQYLLHTVNPWLKTEMLALKTLIMYVLGRLLITTSRI